ncbi:F-box protein CPR1-like [Silene latifolia]|uniref:F-box protein CPR1-like n=1 Tax=Silene latifolia TaxID=37657 RepID=UPI003D777DD9
MLDNLPIEISTNILHRLGVKTLIKCTTLSKSFLSLITSQDFISTHIAQHTNSHLLLRYFTLDSEEKYHFEPDDDTFSGFQTQGLLVPFLNYPDDCFTVAGCVNGVLCLVNDFRIDGTLIILWNPSIRKFVHVPQPIMVFQTHGAYESVCGFGFDSISDDYKVVRVVDLDAPHWTNPELPTQVEVFSLKTGCWRVIGDGPNYIIKWRKYGYITRFINGSVYWIGSYIQDLNKIVIIKFDMSTESFEIIQLPEILIENESTSTPVMNLKLYVQEYKGNLSLIIRNYNDAIKICSVWLMKEDGVFKTWTKMFDFDIAKLEPCAMPRAFGFRKNGEVIIVKGGHNIYSGGRNENVVTSTDVVTHDEIPLREVSVDCFSFYLSTYVESMVLFKEGKGIGEQTTQLDLFELRNQDDLMQIRNPRGRIRGMLGRPYAG